MTGDNEGSHIQSEFVTYSWQKPRVASPIVYWAESDLVSSEELHPKSITETIPHGEVTTWAELGFEEWEKGWARAWMSQFKQVALGELEIAITDRDMCKGTTLGTCRKPGIYVQIEPMLSVMRSSLTNLQGLKCHGPWKDGEGCVLASNWTSRLCNLWEYTNSDEASLGE